MERGSVVEERVVLWWKIYSEEIFPLLVPFRRWAKVETEIDLGAIVLVQYASKVASDRYRMGRVVELFRGRDGLVRTVRVALRNRRKGAREHRMMCKAGTTTLVLPVQRLVILLPGSEQPREIIQQMIRRQAEGSEGGREGVPVGARVRVASEGEEVLDLV